MNAIVWQSNLTAEMVSNLTEAELSKLIDALNDAVAQTCEDWEVA